MYVLSSLRRVVAAAVFAVLLACATLPARAQVAQPANNPTGGFAPAPTGIAPLTPLPRRDNGKKRIAVVPFEFGNIQHWWGNDDWDIGRDLADQLITAMVRQGSYSVLERKMLDRVLGEQAISTAGLIDPDTAAQVGRLLGVNAVVVGSITQFGFDERGTSGFLGMGRTREIRAVVVVNVRLVDPTTGEVLGAVTARGEGRGRGRDSGGRKEKGGVAMTKCTFENTYMATAVQQCVEQMATERSKAEPRVVFSRQELRGKVADYDGLTAIFNVGADNGVEVGDVFAVERVVRQVRDPDTGRVIRDVTEQIGTVTITKVEPLSACGRFMGTIAPKAGDHIRRMERPRAATP
jgi:curli biogenesis system outer membrane secretion channel CsgG